MCAQHRIFLFIALGYVCHANGIKIDPVFLVLRAALHAELREGLAGLSAAISSTSRSAVGLEKPYTPVTTNPPIHSRRTSASTAASSSPRKESQGSGIDLLGTCVGKMFALHVREEIPVARGSATMLAEPRSLSLSHRVVAERILPRQSRALKSGTFYFAKKRNFLNCVDTDGANQAWDQSTKRVQVNRSLHFALSLAGSHLAR